MSATIEVEARLVSGAETRVVGLFGDCYRQWCESHTQGWTQEQLENLTRLAKKYPIGGEDYPPPEESGLEIPYKTFLLVHSIATNIAENNPGMSLRESTEFAWDAIIEQCTSGKAKGRETVNDKKRIGDWGVRERMGRSTSNHTQKNTLA